MFHLFEIIIYELYNIVSPSLINDTKIQVAVRVAYGNGLPKLGANNNNVVAMDGDTKNSTYAIQFKVH